MMSDNVAAIIIVCGICVVLPCLIVWHITRKKTNETNKRAEILLAALEKNVDIDTESISKMMAGTSKKKSVKKTLLNRLLVGCVASFVGLALIGNSAFKYMDGVDPVSISKSCSCGVICLGIGIAFLLNYFIGKRFLAKEIKCEENNLEVE